MTHEDLPEDLRTLLDEALQLDAEGDLAAARDRWEEALDVAEALGTPKGHEVATEVAARLGAQAPNDRQARAWREKARDLGEAAGTPRSLRIAAEATWAQADAYVHHDRLDQAQACYRDAIELGQAAGTSHGVATAAWASLDLARVLLAADQPRDALPVIEQGLDLAETHDRGFPDLVSMLTVALGRARAEAGDLEGAVAAWRRGVDMGRPPLRDAGDVPRREAARAGLALGIHLGEHDDPEAAAALEEAVTLGSFQRPDQPWHAGSHAALEASIRLAGLTLAEGREEAAQAHLDTAAELLARAREVLPEEGFEALAGSLAADAQLSEPLARGWRELRQGDEGNPAPLK